MKNSIEAESEIIERSRQETIVDNYTQVLKDKGLSTYFCQMEQKFIEPRVCLGYLNKKGNHNLTKYRKRFFILISARSLVKTISIRIPMSLMV